MASLSLPRVLQLKKNSLDAEREQFEKFQSLAISKAINSVETPVKEKHVRSTIIGTFREQSAITYWMVALRLPLQDNRIVAWKFCHVTHKLLREGHPACLDDSQRHITMIENLAKLWVHLREGYGRLVNLYCNLLVTKLKFHARNPRFPGNMALTADELDNIAENDVNNYFQLCVELFDYMDDILALQAAVFDSLGNARANSMTASGQCRLAALIPCAQDASQIYDTNVRLLFRLHAFLPPDTLSGHRQRFQQQFKKLSQFYKHASSLQYYRNLLTLPVLPSNPPNFLLQSDFGTYVTPVVSIPDPPPDEVDSVGSLIDTSDTISQATTPDHLDAFDTRATPSPQPDPIIERDRLIDHLQNELGRLRSEASQMVQERNTMLGSMKDHYMRLETQLQAAKIELEKEKQKAELLSSQTPEMQKKLIETEEKAKVTDDKFQKLKAAYSQLREEHINLIRQKAEIDKMAAGLRAAAVQSESAKAALQQQLNDSMKDMEILQQNASSSEEIEAYKTEITHLRAELEQSRQKETELETLKASIEALEIEHKTATAEQEEKLMTVTNELKEVTENLEKVKQDKEESDNELNRIKGELIGLREKSGDEYKKVVEEKEAALKQMAELTLQYQQEKQEQLHCINGLKDQLETLEQIQKDAEQRFEAKCENMTIEFTSKNQELDEALAMKNSEIIEALDKLAILQAELENIKHNYDEKINNKDSEIANLQDKINEFIQNKDFTDSTIDGLKEENNKIKMEITEEKKEKSRLIQALSEKEADISNLGNLIKELEENNKNQNEVLLETEKLKNQEISELQLKLDLISEEKGKEIERLQLLLQEKIEFGDKQMTEGQSLLNTISELQTSIKDKNKEIEALKSHLDATTDTLVEQKSDFESQLKENEYNISLLNEKLQTVTHFKDEIITDLKALIAEKDERVIALNIEVNKLSGDVANLEAELKESQAELEIGRNEFLILKEEHEAIIAKNETDTALKNQEVRSLHDKINELHQKNAKLEAEKEKSAIEFALEKEVLENKMNKLEEIHETTVSEYNTIQNETTEVISKLNSEIESLKLEHEKYTNVKEKEIKSFSDKIQDLENNYTNQISQKEEQIVQSERSVDELKRQLDELQTLREKEKADVADEMMNKDKAFQMLQARLELTDNKRLNAECELQDLLQHNQVLEADLGALRKQLEDTQKMLEQQSTKLVTCTSDAALEVTNEALAALERSDVKDSNRVAAELAAKALEELAKQIEVKGNEETLARSAMFAAHNTATLSAYVTEVCNTSTDMELSDKLSNECRTMLAATKQCLESLKNGTIQGSSCTEARGYVKSLAQAATTADRLNNGTRSVDDELSDMDKAIEEAAKQIEEMLVASKAGDSGVKLEVNGNILDACTTLMGAVKILVQDARKLQNELGDPKTRQKMYRRNPQWSEGLISAAKAVVFAAKLLVSSADEAVGASGRVEGVSAAAHEVAGSTAQLVAASRARAPPSSPALAQLTQASRSVAAATGAVVAAVRAGSALVNEQEALDTSALTLTATRRLEMECKVRSLELEVALDAERARLAALRKRHYQLAQMEENGNLTNGK